MNFGHPKWPKMRSKVVTYDTIVYVATWDVCDILVCNYNDNAMIIHIHISSIGPEMRN